jgi:hypothetical protein
MLKKIIMFALVIVPLLGFTTRAIAEPTEIVPAPTFEQEMNRIFGDKTEIAYAVIMHESNMNYKAINYNCIYNGKSTFCKKGDESKAWSVDCGVAQINVRGLICPSKLFTQEGQIEAIERIYKSQGLNAWVSYKNGSYLKFL